MPEAIKRIVEEINANVEMDAALTAAFTAGLSVPLCHRECHIFGKHAVHNDPETMRRLHQYGQRKAMAEQGWSVQDFIREFGKNYLEDEA